MENKTEENITVYVGPERSEIYYKMVSNMHIHTANLSADYGRWLTSSLLLLHAGAIAGLLTFLGQIGSNSNMALSKFGPAIWSSVAGLMIALVCGFTTWLNWSKQAEAYSELTNAEILCPQNHVPGGPHPHIRVITWTYWISMITGWGSGLCILLSAYFVCQALN